MKIESKCNLKKTLKTNQDLCISSNMDEIFKTKCNIDDFDLSQKLWKQIIVDGTVTQAINRPLIKEITSINGDVQILNQKVLKAPTTISVRNFEGLQGGKRIIKLEGLICFSINYISFSKDEIIHTFHDKIPFSTVINLPLNGSGGNDSLDYLYIISACIEDIRLKSIIKRDLNMSIMLIISATKSFNKEDFCESSDYLKNLNIDCNEDVICKNCTNEILTKGIFPQEKIEFILDQNQKYTKRIISTDVLKITKSNPKILKLLSINFNIKVLCQRVVKTPVILGRNLENKKLTGFMLLVDYIIEYHFKYSSDTSFESVHSALFETPASFYIILPDTTLFSDKFKISYYVDDIYACVLNEREIFKSISVLFHANPIFCKIKPVNSIIFKGENDSEIVTIDIYSDSKLFKVFSTGEIANISFSQKYYFSFKLIDSKGQEKISLTVNGNENADDFEISLNNKSFEERDIINLTYREKNNVTITNYKNQDEYHPENFSESYVITSDGLIPNNINILQNVITFKGKDNIEVAIVRFNKDNSTLIVDSSGLIANENLNSNQVYFSLTLNDNKDVEKFKSEVLENDDADNFRNTLNKKSFEYDDILTLTYEEANKVIITDYEGKDEYNPKGTSESYKITPNGLEAVAGNTITFKGKNDSEIAKIKFNFNSKTLLVTSTHTEANSDFQNKPYFSFILDSSYKIQTQKATVNGDDTADNFMVILNNKSFNENDIINLTYRERSRVTISNFEGQSNYNPKYFSESYRISNDGLEPNNSNILNNVIIFKGKDDVEVAIVRFNIDNNTLIADSSGLQANIDFSTDMYFSFEIKDGFNTEKIKSQVLGNEDADDFMNILNNFKFNFGDILTLEYRDNIKVFITNYEGTPDYNPKNNSESYEITPNGLKPLSDITTTSIIINGSDNFSNPVKFAQIDFSNNKLIVASTGSILATMFANLNAFQLIIKKSTIRAQKSLYIRGDENAETFKNAFNDYELNIGDILRFRYIAFVTILIKNYFGYQTYTAPKYTSSFQITPNGLKPFNFNLFNQTIILTRSVGLKEIIFINFAKGLKIFVTPTGAKLNVLTFRTKAYFTFILKSKTGSIKFNQSLNGTQNSVVLGNSLDEQNFSYDDIIRLKYRDNSMVTITNFNNENEYNPKFYSERYVIRRTGLELLPNKFLNNIITVKDKDNKEIIIIRFDITETIFILDSSGISPNTDFGDETYFSLTLKESNNATKLTGNLKGNEDGDNFSNIFDEKSFDLGNILTLTYKDNARVDITNLEGQEIYHPQNTEESYLITKDGLVPIKNLLPNILAFRGRGIGDIGSIEKKLMATIAFNKTTMQLISDSTGRISNIIGTEEYFSLSLSNNLGDIITKYTVNKNINANDFSNNLNGTPFEYSYIINLHYVDSSRVDIANIDDKEVYNPTGFEISYIVDPSGLIFKK